MSEEQKQIEVFETRRFTKALGKLAESQLVIVEDEIENIIEDPELGELKKGDLSHLRVHKFKIDTQQVLLGYAWLEGKIEIYLLHLGPHENFYQQQKKQRKVDPKHIPPARYAGYKTEYRHPVLNAFRSYYDYDEHFTMEQKQIARASYFGLCSFVDDLIGDVLGALEGSGQMQNTNVLFTSDHGELNGHHGLWTKMTI